MKLLRRRVFFVSHLLFAFAFGEAMAYDHLAASVDEFGARLVLLDSQGDPMPAIRSNGYNVVTWDPRGEFDSEGRLQLDHPEWVGYHVFDILSSIDYFSFTSLSVADNALMPVGSQIWISMSLVSAPEEGEFGFWEADAPAPTHRFASDGSGGSYNFILSQWDEGVPDTSQDPGGNIEGRIFTTTLPGDYYVKFQLYDTQGILDPSEEYTFRFTAVPEPNALFFGLTALALLGLRRRRWSYRS